MLISIFSFDKIDISNIISSSTVLLLGISIIWFVIRKIRSEMRTESDLQKKQRLIKKVLYPIVSLLIFIWLKINLPDILPDGSVSSNISQFISIAIIGAIAWISISVIHVMKVILMKRFDLTEKDNLRARKFATQFKIIERILIFIIIFVAISAALMTFASIRKLGVSLFASAGVAGIILGLAAQKGIGTILAGFQIAITQPIRIDDVVIVEGEWGWIEEITLTYVVIRIWDKRRLVVPTTYFLDKPFENWTRNSADILGTVYIYADYKVPVDQLRKELKRILGMTNLWDGNVSNIQITDARENTLEMRILVSAADSPTAWDLRVYIREKMIDFLQKNYPDTLPRTRINILKKENENDLT